MLNDDIIKHLYENKIISKNAFYAVLNSDDFVRLIQGGSCDSKLSVIQNNNKRSIENDKVTQILEKKAKTTYSSVDDRDCPICMETIRQVRILFHLFFSLINLNILFNSFFLLLLLDQNK